MKRDEITPDVLKSVLDCDAEKGALFWRARESRFFGGCDKASKVSANRWNSRFVGSRAFITPDGGGYLMGKLFGINFRAHRVVYAMQNESWPKGEIDHINGVRSDNRISNLRDVSRFENSHNKTINKNNTSGQMGVRLAAGLWVAQIHFKGYKVDLGKFYDKDEAIKARKTAEIAFGYHENHGRTE
jgi:hypothetical protein